MRSITLSISITLLLWLAAAGLAVGQAAPPSPRDVRNMLLEEVRQFRKIDKPDLSGAIGEEHVCRALSRRFLGAQFRARLVLAYVGDETAIEELVKKFDLRQGDRLARMKTWREPDYDDYYDWLEKILELARALEPARPELAGEIRRDLMLWWEVKRRDAATYGRKETLDQLPLQEVKNLAQNPVSGNSREAMMRWARLDPKEATPWLVQQLAGHSTFPDRCAAARALAAIGNDDGLNWLSQACRGKIDFAGGQDEQLCDQLLAHWQGPTDRDARQLARLWVDDLQQSTDVKQWQLGSGVFLGAGVGTRDSAAAGARRHLKDDPPLACQILAEAGQAEDAILIWKIAHESVERTPLDPFAVPKGRYAFYYWLPVIRLTQEPAPQELKKTEDRKGKAEKAAEKGGQSRILKKAADAPALKTIDIDGGYGYLRKMTLDASGELHWLGWEPGRGAASEYNRQMSDKEVSEIWHLASNIRMDEQKEAYTGGNHTCTVKFTFADRTKSIKVTFSEKDDRPAAFAQLMERLWKTKDRPANK